MHASGADATVYVRFLGQINEFVHTSKTYTIVFCHPVTGSVFYAEIQISFWNSAYTEYVDTQRHRSALLGSLVA